MVRRSLCTLVMCLLMGITSLSQGIPQNLEPIQAASAPRLQSLVSLGAGAATDLVWSPRGDTIAIGTGAGIWLYNAQDIMLPPTRLEVGAVASLAYNSDGSLLAIGTDNGAVQVFSVPIPQPLLTWQVQPSSPQAAVTVVSVMFSYDDKLIAAATSRNVSAIYELASQQTLWQEENGNQPLVVRFSPDNKLLALGNASYSVDLRDVLSGKSVYDWRLDSLAIGGITDVAFNPIGNRLLIGGSGQRILALDVDFGEQAFVWDALTNDIQQVEWSLDGRRVSIANHSLIDPNLDVVQIWDATQGGAEVARLVGHRGIIRGLSFSPDGARIATVSDDGTLRLWDANTGQELAQLTAHFGASSSVSLSPDGALLALADGNVRLWDIRAGRMVQSLANGDILRSAHLLPNASLLGVGNPPIGGGKVSAWQPPSPDARLLKEFGSPLRFLTVSPDYQQAFASDAMGSYLVLLGDGFTLPLADSTGVVSCAYKPDMTQFATGNERGAIHIWSSDGSTRRTLTEQVSPITSLAYHPNGALLASGDAEGILRLWDIASDFPSWRVFLTGGVRQLLFSSDGSLLVVLLTSGEVQFYEGLTGIQLMPSTPLTRMNALTFSNDGRLLIGAGADGIIHIWGVAS